MILVSCETSDWGFRQKKWILIRRDIKAQKWLYSTCYVPLAHFLFTHPWNVSEKHWATTSTFLPMENAVQHYLRTK